MFDAHTLLEGSSFFRCSSLVRDVSHGLEPGSAAITPHTAPTTLIAPRTPTTVRHLVVRRVECPSGSLPSAVSENLISFSRALDNSIGVRSSLGNDRVDFVSPRVAVCIRDNIVGPNANFALAPPPRRVVVPSEGCLVRVTTNPRKKTKTENLKASTDEKPQNLRFQLEFG